MKPHVKIKVDTVVKTFYTTLMKWLDSKPTGMLRFEIHAFKGGINRFFKEKRDEIIDSDPK